MILLTTNLSKAEDFATTLQNAAGQEVRIAPSLKDAFTQLQTREFSAVVIDQLLLDAEPGELEPVLKHLGTAVPVYVNFAVSNSDRLMRELLSALDRHQRAVLQARESAQQTLRSELKDTLTALLLSCEMALTVEGLPSEAASRISNVHQLGTEIGAKLAS